jgi:hypothetical protein
MEKKKVRCPMGVPAGILVTLFGLVGIVFNIINFDWFNFGVSLALFLIGGPFVRLTMMIHSANDRLDELERKIDKK